MPYTHKLFCIVFCTHFVYRTQISITEVFIVILTAHLTQFTPKHQRNVMFPGGVYDLPNVTRSFQGHVVSACLHCGMNAINVQQVIDSEAGSSSNHHNHAMQLQQLHCVAFYNATKLLLGLLRQMSHVAWSACLSVCLCVGHTDVLWKKLVNRSTYRLRGWLMWIQRTRTIY